MSPVVSLHWGGLFFSVGCWGWYLSGLQRMFLTIRSLMPMGLLPVPHRGLTFLAGPPYYVVLGFSHSTQIQDEEGTGLFPLALRSEVSLASLCLLATMDTFQSPSQAQPRLLF